MQRLSSASGIPSFDASILDLTPDPLRIGVLATLAVLAVRGLWLPAGCSGLEWKDYLDSAYGFGPALADAEREGQLGASEIQSPGAELSSASGIPSFDASILDLTPDP